MLQPKVYIKSLGIELEATTINFLDREVEVYNEYNKSIEDASTGFESYFFDEVEFIENTGFKDNNGKYIYVGDTVTLDDEYGDDYKVMQDEDELTFYLEPIKPFSITDKEIQLRKSMEYKITIIEMES